MYGRTIRKDNDYINQSDASYYPVVIIGAGESGIAMGCRLKEQLGFDQFRIFDRQSGIGGVSFRISGTLTSHTDFIFDVVH